MNLPQFDQHSALEINRNYFSERCIGLSAHKKKKSHQTMYVIIVKTDLMNEWFFEIISKEMGFLFEEHIER